jgi:hypothetical protein
MQTLAHRRAIANSLALKQGLPVTQAAIDARWGGIIAKLNASLPTSRTPIAAGRTSPASSTAAGRVDASVDWSAIATDLNREAGLPGRRAS